MSLTCDPIILKTDHMTPQIPTDATLLVAANDYGLFLSDEDPKKGIWLEAGKALDYYMLRNGVSSSCNACCDLFKY